MPGQFFVWSDADGVVRAKIVGDGAEIRVVRTHDDGHAELSRLQRVVAAGRDEAAADEGDGGERIDRSQFADGVEQDDLSGLSKAIVQVGRIASTSRNGVTHGIPDCSKQA